MKRILNRNYFFNRLDYIALVIILSGLIWTNLYYQFWKNPGRIIVHDVVLYYQYLPAAIIHKDLSLNFTKEDPEFYKNKVWKITTDKGRAVSKMTMGLAVLYSPFFLVAHALAEKSGYPADGYTIPYRIALIISSVFYAIIGFIFLIRLLRKYFARGIIALTILAIGLGTNLYFYTTLEPTMSHAYSFFLFAAFIYFVDLWVQKQNWLSTVLIGLFGGLIILVRPTNGIIFLILPLWNIESWTDLKERIILFFRKFGKTIAISLLTVLVFLPQVVYWKYTTGDYFFYSYRNEQFFFNDPAFIQGLFSFRKGWLIYTPIMTFSLLGIIVLYFRNRKLFWPVFIFTFLNLYVVFSWWCWWYGGGFGQRALIESYALLAIPFAAFTKYIFSRKLIFRTIFLIFFLCFIGLNMFQTRQYYIGIIHWDGMTKYTYMDSFFRVKIAPNFYNHIERPDYKAAMNGDR